MISIGLKKWVARVGFLVGWRVGIEVGLSVSVTLVMGMGLGGQSALGTSLNIARKSVFKIMVDTSMPSFSEPWKRQPEGGGTGTGFYIGMNQILTNAHVVAYASFIKILRDGDSTPIPAVVKFIAHDCDLAILVPIDPQSLHDVREVSFGRVPRLQSPVTTVGFPTGGDQLSITQGIVSRISFRRYVHDGISDHLLIQVDSAINPGNSGGPVFQGGSVIGVAFQAFTQAENTGYIIPTPVIRHFLKDIEDGVYDGHPADGISTMEAAMENSASSAFVGLKKEDGGVKVAHVASWSAAAGKMAPGDVLLEIDGQPIGNDGKINFMGERVSFRVIYDLKQVGETVTFRLNHDGGNQKVSFPAGHVKPYPQMGNIFGRHPKFFVYGGLVFTALSRSFMRNWGERWYNEAPLNLRYMLFNWTYLKDIENLQDIIVLAKLLPDPVNTYARANVNGIVKSVDKKDVHSMEELIELLEKGQSEYAHMEFITSDEPTVLSRAEVKLRSPLINKKYGVVPDRWLAGAEEDAAMVAQSKSPGEMK